MSDDWNADLDERRALIRQVRQQLESLGRAGVVDIYRSPDSQATEAIKVVPRTRIVGPAPDSTQHTGGSVEPRVESRPCAVSQPVPTPTARPTTPSIQPSPIVEPPPVLGSLFQESRIDTPIVPETDRSAILATSALEVAACKRCPHLASTRTQTVFGTGSPTARLMFIGEAPGADEDRTGQPFVGVAGQLLTDMITKGMGLRREDVYIANVLKCRPPGNRTPTPEEAANCSSYLDHQIAVIRPEFLCLLGKTAACALLDFPTTTTMGPLRKRWHRYRGIKTLVTYHPSYLLRTQSAKKDAWEDLQLLMKEMGLEIPRRK